MLEDDPERLKRFTAVWRALRPDSEFRSWRNAYTMIDEASPLLPTATVISLDHDLEPDTAGGDPGDGYLLTQWLVSQPIVRPVIIHTSNSPRALWMAGACDLANWRHYRVAPLGEDWIESDWRMVVCRLLKRPRER